MKKSILLKALFLSLIISCSSPAVKIPPEVITQDKMVPILVDAHLAEAGVTLNYINRDTAKIKAEQYYNIIYTKYNTTKKQFTNSYDFYLTHPELLNKIYDQVLIDLSKKQAETVKNK